MPNSGDAGGRLRRGAATAFHVPAAVSTTTRETPAPDEHQQADAFPRERMGGAAASRGSATEGRRWPAGFEARRRLALGWSRVVGPGEPAASPRARRRPRAPKGAAIVESDPGASRPAETDGDRPGSVFRSRPFTEQMSCGAVFDAPTKANHIGCGRNHGACPWGPRLGPPERPGASLRALLREGMTRTDPQHTPEKPYRAGWTSAATLLAKPRCIQTGIQTFPRERVERHHRNARNATRVSSGSACLEVVAERFADDCGRGLLITLGALRERTPELWIETYGLDARWA